MDLNVMTPKARACYLVYRDMGPTRSLPKLTELVSHSIATVRRWSALYKWTDAVCEHDHVKLREALGKRELQRETGLQSMVDAVPAAIKVMVGIMMDTQVLPIMDRQGQHMRAADNDDGTPGALMYKPLVKASTKAQCAEKVLGIAGLVPVKRTITEDRTQESLDEAAGITRSMTPAQLEALAKILMGKDGSDG